MTVPTSNERREVAARLRKLADGERPTAECSVYDLYMALGLPYLGTGIEYAVIGHLADLIDPTCRNVSGYLDVFECSECRCRVELTGEPFHVPLMASFCPNCGARVVNDR